MWESAEAKRLKMARGKEEGNVLDMKLFCQYFREKKHYIQQNYREASAETLVWLLELPLGNQS